MHECRRQHTVSGTARNQKPETRRQRTPNPLVKAHCYRDRRRVIDLRQFARKARIDRLKHRSRSVRRRGNDYGIKLVALVSRRNRPAPVSRQ